MNKGSLMNKTFSPTQAILNNVQRGNALAKRLNKNVVNLFKSFNRSEPVVISKQMTITQVKDLYNNLTKLETKVDLKKANPDGTAPSDTILWYLNGGAPALAWSKMILKKEGIIKSHTSEISDEQINSEKKNHWNKSQIIKSVDEKLKQATFVVLQPNVVDAHGDIYDETEVRKAKESFNSACMKANLFHMVQTDKFSFIESYVAPAEMIINGEYISKGTWLATIQAHDDDLWKAIENGEITGLSVGCTATVEYLEEDDE